MRLAKPDDLLLGETVIALGNPFNLGASVAGGSIELSRRFVLTVEGGFGTRTPFTVLPTFRF